MERAGSLAFSWFENLKETEMALGKIDFYPLKNRRLVKLFSPWGLNSVIAEGMTLDLVNADMTQRKLLVVMPALRFGAGMERHRRQSDSIGVFSSGKWPVACGIAERQGAGEARIVCCGSLPDGSDERKRYCRNIGDDMSRPTPQRARCPLSQFRHRQTCDNANFFPGNSTLRRVRRTRPTLGLDGGAFFRVSIRGG